MKDRALLNRVITVVFTIILIATASFAQRALTNETFRPEIRPFDLNDKYYGTNGLDASLFKNRKNGFDGESVFDFSPERQFNNVRITATMPAYDDKGHMLFWNHHADVFSYGFTPDRAGQYANSVAEKNPIYIFPSVTHPGSERQAALITLDTDNGNENPLGVRAVVLVEYVARARSTEHEALLKRFADTNGISLDGTPIIRTKAQLDELIRKGLVRLTVRGDIDGSKLSYSISRVMEFPTGGSITDDAFLIYVKQDNGLPLDSEAIFVETFECVKRFASECKMN